MCVPCVLQVSRAFTFKQNCQRSDQTLRTYLGSRSDKTEFRDINKHTELRNVEDGNTIVKVEKSVTNRLEEPEQFSVIDETTTDHLDSQLDLDSLPAEIEPNSFEEDIELSNLTSSLADNDNDIQQQLSANLLHSSNELTTNVAKESKTGTHSKCGDYFDDIKLDDVENVISLADNELPGRAIERTFGESLAHSNN